MINTAHHPYLYFSLGSPSQLQELLHPLVAAGENHTVTAGVSRWRSGAGAGAVGSAVLSHTSPSCWDRPRASRPASRR